MTDSWIRDQYLRKPYISSLQDQYNQLPSKPIFIKNFMSDNHFHELQQCILNIPNYCRDYSIITENDEVMSVSKDKWESSQKSHRWNKQDIVKPLGDLLKPGIFSLEKDTRLFQDFVKFAILGDELSLWLSEIVGRTLNKKVSCEIVRYHKGDYIVEHKDTHDNRVIGINFYIGPDWEKDYGGELGFKNEQGSEFFVSPLPNSLSIIPISHSCSHWVKPWLSNSPGRHTISMSFRPENL